MWIEDHVQYSSDGETVEKETFLGVRVYVGDKEQILPYIKETYQEKHAFKPIPDGYQSEWYKVEGVSKLPYNRILLKVGDEENHEQ